MTPFIPRVLKIFDEGKNNFLSAEGMLSAKKYEARPIVVLGEPGSGKTELLNWLAYKRDPNQSRYSAQVIVRNQQAIPKSTDLVFVDDPDELAALKEGEGLHDILERFPISLHHIRRR